MDDSVLVSDNGKNNILNLSIKKEINKTPEFDLYSNISLRIHGDYYETVDRDDDPFPWNSIFLKEYQEHIFQSNSIYTHIEVAFKF